MTQEEIVRNELKSLRDLGLRLAQWGVTVLIGVQMALYYVRKDVHIRLIAANIIKKGDLLPASYYFWGTAFLFIIAGIFSFFLLLISNSYRHYKHLIETKEVPVTVPISPQVARKAPRLLIFLLFFIFPLLDIIVRGWFTFNFEFHVH